ncbi:hypothetical protein OG943_47080 [Amycolatopsis sp. NBC_00345]|uniref:hypothetical protein n=1 Tax=Amycolatopsis sp. NBC_00345 TaxID=2975955 RepID=UPI002E272E14
MSELLIGLSAELMYSGVTNRHENAPRFRSSPASPATAGPVVSDEVIGRSVFADQ